MIIDFMEECPFCNKNKDVCVGKGVSRFCGNAFASAKLEMDKDEKDNGKPVQIYVSMPECGMGTYGRALIFINLAEAASDYLNAVVEVCEPDTEGESSELEVIAARLKAMADAEYVVFPEGYELERECRLEHMAAREYGKKILIEIGENIQEEY